jgi:hypothetical protein
MFRQVMGIPYVASPVLQYNGERAARVTNSAKLAGSGSRNCATYRKVHRVIPPRGHFWEPISGSTLVLSGMQFKLLGKITTMISWFMSPWEAARLSLEAQRVMASHFIRLASGREQPNHDVSVGEPRLVDQSVVASGEPAIRASSRRTGVPKTVAARKAMGTVIRKPGASKVKNKRTKKGKNR